MLRQLVCLGVVVGACANEASESGDDSVATFDDCSAPTATCGLLTARWTIDRFGKTSTCAAVSGARVSLAVTFQADGRVATFTAACDAGAILTSKLPLGPYALSLRLDDATAKTLDTQSATATLGVAGTVAEANVAFDVKPAIKAGELFGECSTTVPCPPALACIALDNGKSYCTPKCENSPQDMTCRTATSSVGGDPADAICFGPPDNWFHCFIACGGSATACPPGLTCQAQQFLGSACMP